MGFAVVAGATLASAYMSSEAAQNGADTMADASRASSAAQLEMYNQTRADQAPWRAAGSQALGQIQNDPSFQHSFNMSDFQKDPGYDFRMQQGQQAIERSAAARGGLNSGATMKALDRYSQGAASDEYQNAYNRYSSDQTNRFNRLSSIAGLGQTANANTGAAGTATAAAIGQNNMGAANAQAAAGMATSNAYGNALNTGANTWMNYQMMNRMFPQQTPSQPQEQAGNNYTSAGMY